MNSICLNGDYIDLIYPSCLHADFIAKHRVLVKIYLNEPTSRTRSLYIVSKSANNSNNCQKVSSSFRRMKFSVYNIFKKPL